MKKKIIILLIFILIEWLAFYLDILWPLNKFIGLSIIFNIIYRLLGLTRIEEEIRKEYPIKVKISPSYIIKVMVRGVKIKYRLIKYLLWTQELRTIIKIITIILISILILRYSRIELIGEVLGLLEDLVSNIIVEWLIIMNIWRYEYNFITNIETKYNLKEDRFQGLVSYMKRVKDELSNKIIRGIDLSILEIESQLNISIKGPKGELEPYKVSKYVEHKGNYVLRKLASKFRRIITGWEPFDPTNLSPCEELLNKWTREEKFEFLINNVREINQCRKVQIKKWKYEISKEERIINEVNKVLINEIVPYVGEQLNYYDIEGAPTEKELKDLDPSHITYEVPYICRLIPFFEEKNLQITLLKAGRKWGEPDFALIPKTGEPLQFGQLKYRDNYKDLWTEIREFNRGKKYGETDWGVFMTIDQILLLQNIYDNPYDIKNRKLINRERYEPKIIEKEKVEIEPIMTNIRNKEELKNELKIKKEELEKKEEIRKDEEKRRNEQERAWKEHARVWKNLDLIENKERKEIYWNRKVVVDEIKWYGPQDERCLKPWEVKRK